MFMNKMRQIKKLGRFHEFLESSAWLQDKRFSGAKRARKWMPYSESADCNCADRALGRFSAF
jgi:hypothetical protein